MSGNQRSSAATGGVAGPVAAALAVLAVLAVVTAGVVAGVEGLGGSSGAGPQPTSPAPTEDTSGATEEETDEAATFFPDGQVVVGDRRINADFEVPAADEGWVVKPPRDQRGFEDLNPDDDVLKVFVLGPAEWNPLRCRDSYGLRTDSPRAWVGFAETTADEGDDGGVDRASADLVGLWRGVLMSAGDADVSRPRYEDATISDGTPARRATLTSVPSGDVDPDECGALAIELTFLTVDTGDYLATLVVSRYTADDGSDLDDGLPADVADQILASPRLQETP